MKSGDHLRSVKRAFSWLLLLALAGALPCHALDSPETPDYVARFESRLQPFTDSFGQQSGAADLAREGNNLLDFLDKEMQAAYAALLRKLEPAEKRSLQAAQKAWLNHYRREKAFIETNWTRDNFGSSYMLSRFSYLSRLKKDRIRTLLSYLKNYRHTDEDAALTKE